MSVNPITIRSLGPEDAFVLDRLRPGLFDAPPDPARIWAFLATRVNDLVVALDQGEVVGMAYGTTQLRPDAPTTFHLGDIRVHPAFRRQGIGRRLLSRLQDKALDRGCEALWLVLEQDNAPARALFEATQTGETTGALVVTLRPD